MTHSPAQVIAGIDTHKDTHTAAAIDTSGRMLGTAQFPASPAGYEALLAWLQELGQPAAAGIEGTGSYGAGLARFLREHHILITEVDRPDRKIRHRKGKSDPVDAEAAARAVLSGHAAGTPKQRDGRVEALRHLRIARRSAISQRTETINQVHAIAVTAPEPLHSTLSGLNTRDLITTCAAATANPDPITDPAAAAVWSLRLLARRYQHLSAEISELDTLLTSLVTQISPQLLACNGIGTDVAGQLLITAGDNPHRMRTESAFAMLCGAAPLPASSGKTHRHRLNRGGDRQANKALWIIAISRLRWNPQTRAYAQRRTKEGLSKKEIIRCLKRYIARDIYKILTLDTP
jgi:transposase